MFPPGSAGERLSPAQLLQRARAYNLSLLGGNGKVFINCSPHCSVVGTFRFLCSRELTHREALPRVTELEIYQC